MNYKLYKPLTIHELGQRQNQEDNIYPVMDKATADDRLFIVCDGMGGHEKGEVASDLVCQSFHRWFAEHLPVGEPLSDEQFREALDYVYSQLDHADDGAVKKMGTTLTFLCLHRDGCTMAHIGDSRIYHVRPSEGAVLYQSRDHSLVFELFQAGEITYDEMRTSPQKNIITRALGVEENVLSDIDCVDINKGDFILLCSDGLTNYLGKETIKEIFNKADNDTDYAETLVEEANRTGGGDNITAVVIKNGSKGE